MKQHLTLSQLALELELQQESKKDYVADTRHMSMVANDIAAIDQRLGPTLLLSGQAELAITPLAHQQIAERLDIPKRYYDRMLAERPALLASNVNTWLGAKPERRMVRTLNSTARAFLSDKYRRIDNFDVAQMVLPVLRDVPDLKIESAALTDTRMYLKAVMPRIQGEVKRGDVVQAGIVISNSEVGLGAVSIELMLFRLVCLNGMIAPGGGTRKNHVGKHVGGDELVAELYRSETVEADNRAFLMKVQDVVRAAVHEAKFNRFLSKLRDATERAIDSPVEAVTELAQRFRLAETESKSVLRHLIEGGDLSAWGVANAVTRVSQDVPDYDRATELERIGGQVIDLSPGEWRQIANAA